MKNVEHFTPRIFNLHEIDIIMMSIAVGLRVWLRI